MLCGQEVGDVTSLISSTAPSDHTCSSLYSKGVARNASPPWREDDKDGHYMFAVGENLTSRCNYLFTNILSFKLFQYSLFFIFVIGHSKGFRWRWCMCVCVDFKFWIPVNIFFILFSRIGLFLFVYWCYNIRCVKILKYVFCNDCSMLF